MNREYNDVYGQVEHDYRENDGGDYNEEEAWVMQVLSGCNDIIKKDGVKFFLDHLPNHAKIAISVYYRNLHNKTEKDPF